MKTLLLFSALLFSCICNAQDSIRTATEKGYEIDYPFVHFYVDTIHHITTITSYYHGPLFGIGKGLHYFSVNGGKARALKKEESFDIWSEHFILTVSHKKYKKIYKL